MKIAMVAPFEETVPPTKYGGTELVVSHIVTVLTKLGHDVTLFASGDSKPACKLISIVPQAIRTQEPYISDMKAREAVKYLGISKIINVIQHDGYDIVHNHIGWRFLLFNELINKPIVTTLHGPMDLAYQRVGFNAKSGLPFVSISDNQRRAYPSLNYVKTVYNGIEIELFPFRGNSESITNGLGEYLFILGRMSPEKGVKEAIEVAKKSGKKLIIAAKVDAVDTKYYEEVKPMIDGQQIVFIGEVGFDQKTELLKNAYALLAPIQWEEPFGLNVVESMACGTPVLGMKRGSFPELITPGLDGFLATSVEEMAAQVGEVGKIDRADCRKTVETRFTREIMAQGYLEVYNKIISG
jgi:glycosyltransferase involved in cell wall biosynthesis